MATSDNLNRKFLERRIMRTVRYALSSVTDIAAEASCESIAAFTSIPGRMKLRCSTTITASNGALKAANGICFSAPTKFSYGIHEAKAYLQLVSKFRTIRSTLLFHPKGAHGCFKKA